MDTKTCTKCGTTKPIEEFSFRHKAKNKRQSWCNKCKAVRDAIRYRTGSYREDKRLKQLKLRQKNRAFLVEYLSDKCCIDCGETCIPCLQFDHKNGETKRSNISNMMDNSRAAILQEIKKCEIRCANCHAKITAAEQGWYICTPALPKISRSSEI